MHKQVIITKQLIKSLVCRQFPQWADLSIKPVRFQGWDNRTFRLGNELSVRMPSAKRYSFKVEKEQEWLPKLSPLLPIQIPQPVAMGEPNELYPWNWSVYRWIEGTQADKAEISDMKEFAEALAEFLNTLHGIHDLHGPEPGAHNFFRGGSLSVYDQETRECFKKLKKEVNINQAEQVWETALASHWNGPDGWVHGDMFPSNLLVKDGKLHAVIDFGGSGFGDPACDLTIAWTFFKGVSREKFCSLIKADQGTWQRAKGWALWKGMLTLIDVNSAQKAVTQLELIKTLLSEQ